MKLARPNAIISILSDEDLSGQEGCLVRMSSNTAVGLVDSAAAIPFGLLLTAGKTGERVSVAIAAGGLAGTVRVKLAGTVYIGSQLQLTADGRAIADLGENSRVLIGIALEPGVTNELIEAVLFRPVTLT